MLKWELEQENVILKDQVTALKDRWFRLIDDLKQSRATMYAQMLNLEGSVQEVDLILENLDEEPKPYVLEEEDAG